MQRVSAKQVKEKLARMHNKEEHTDFWRRLLANSSQLLLARRLGRKVEKQLTESDIPLRGEEFVVIVAASGITAGTFFSLITMNVLTGLMAAIASSLLPFLFVRTAHARRVTKLNAQIGDALSIMSNSLRSGFSFLQAMDMVRRELPDPISKEFSRTFREINLGTSTEEALQNLVHRVNSEDMELIVTAVMIQRQVGGNLAEVLDNIGKTIRERIRIKGEIKTLTAQGRISGIIIGFLPVVLAVIMTGLNPEYIMTLFTSEVGRLMLLAAIGGELLGILLIKRIVNIQV
ncbi:MAG: type II secretion system F family protein [Firmicutes bacterium]|nr:type II secretion system F family protein [Bacillota bacterium]